MKLKKSLTAIALASSLFLTANLTCSAPYVRKHKITNKEYKQIKKPKNKYVILVLGAFPDEDMLDEYLQERALKVYDGLKELGFSDDDIYFLSTWRSGKEMKDTDYFFTKHRFKQVCSELSSKITEDDMLIFWYIGHSNEVGRGPALIKNEKEPGVAREGGTTFSLDTLETEIRKLEYSHAVVIFDSCHSGKFAKSLGKENRVGVSTTYEDQLGWIFSDFSIYLVEALNGEKEADKNKDNKVSLEEAVYYAAKKDPWSKKEGIIRFFFPQPQIYCEEVDPSEVFLKD